MVVLQFHLIADSPDASWWVDSPDVPELYASAPRLVDCERLALRLLGETTFDNVDVRCVLAGTSGRLAPRTDGQQPGLGTGRRHDRTLGMVEDLSRTGSDSNPSGTAVGDGNTITAAVATSGFLRESIDTPRYSLLAKKSSIDLGELCREGVAERVASGGRALNVPAEGPSPRPEGALSRHVQITAELAELSRTAKGLSSHPVG